MPTTYLAPGVYVEEVPSAQQPIAGVGTNTVGFIGVVPDIIRIPVPNDWYDPNLAEIVHRGEGSTDKEKAEHAAALAQLDALVDREKKKDTLAQELGNTIKRLEADERRLTDEIAKKEAELKAPPEGMSAAEAKARERQLTRDIQGLRETQLKGVTAQLTETRNRQTQGVTRDDFLRPYRIKTVPVTHPPGDAKLCTNFTEYVEYFGSYSVDEREFAGHRALTHAVSGFFKNGGTRCFVVRVTSENADEIEQALRDFETVDEIAIVAAPGLTPGRQVWGQLVTHCEEMKDRFAILDPPEIVGKDDDLNVTLLSYSAPPDESLLPERNRNAAFYFPYLEVFDPAKQLQDQDPTRKRPAKHRGKVYVPPSGHIAGVYARVDAERGVHKAPGNEAVLGANDVKYYIGRRHQDLLNPQGVNCIRSVDGNIRVYGARTIGGDKNGEWKYVNVRRVMLFLKESIDEGTQWVVFEPNDSSLWGKIRRNVSAFLTNVWRSGALIGTTPQEAFYVKCDAETNPPEVRDLGQVITEIGVAIVRPAEFVIFRVTQWTGPNKS